MNISFFSAIHDMAFTMSLVSARIMPSFMMLPFLNNNTLTGMVRMPVAMIVGVSLWPFSFQALSVIDPLVYLALVVKEAVIGLSLACFLCFPFWMLHAVGGMVDNQRGATLSSTIDPLSGVDTSELANFFNLFASVIVLESGGLLLMVQVFHNSYLLFDPLSFTIPSMQPSLIFLGNMVAESFIMASPLLVIFLLTEALLGILSRFAPQMNAFSIALTVKSTIAFFILLLYFSSYFPSKIISMALNNHTI